MCSCSCRCCQRILLRLFFPPSLLPHMTPVTIERVSLRQVNLPPKVLRTDAIQSFVTQETILLTLHCSDGIAATGYAYTIGTGGS